MATVTESLTKRSLKKSEYTKENLIHFSDAVIAIAITLLAIDIKLPEVLEAAGNQYLISALLDLWPKFLSYAISFVVIAVYWYNYHKIISYVDEADNNVVFLSIVFLFFVTIMPFTASMLGQYGDESIVVILYAGSVASGSAALFLLWRHILRKYLQAEKTLDNRFIYYLSVRTGFPVVVALLSMVIAMFNPFVATIVLLLDPVSLWLKHIFRLEE